MRDGPPNEAQDQYHGLMLRIRARFEIIEGLKLNPNSDLGELETAAFHLRKIIEGIAFACLVALKNGLKSIPRNAVGQWNADTIFSRLAKAGTLVFPSPFLREDPGPEAEEIVKFHIGHDSARAMSVDEVREAYQRTHAWLHEWNPYINLHVSDFAKRRCELISDCHRVWNLMNPHIVYIGGKVFMGTLKTPDGNVEVVAAEAMS